MNERYDRAEERPAVRYEDLELTRLTEDEREPTSRSAVWIVTAALAVLATFAIVALLVWYRGSPSRAEPENPPSPAQPEATTRVPASVVASPRPGLTPAPSVASLAGGVGSEGGAIPPTTSMSDPDEALGVLPDTGTIQAGTATYCAPTPRYCQGWGGGAMLGAVKSFRWGDRPYNVRVCHAGRCVVVRVVSYCACGVTLIDLSPAAFKRLAPLWKGRIRVTVERVGHGSAARGPVGTLPPTSTR